MKRIALVAALLAGALVWLVPSKGEGAAKPAGFTGKIVVELDPVMGPFQWTMISTGNVVE